MGLSARNKILFALIIPLLFGVKWLAPKSAEGADEEMFKKIYEFELSQGKSYERLRYLCKEIGQRLSGSEGAAKAVAWTKSEMEKLGADNVFLQDVMVPHWVRGEKESAWIYSTSGKKNIPVCALGGSVNTGKKGIRAKVIEVHSLEEVGKLDKSKVEGKIVFYNRPMNPKDITTFTAYGGAVDQRSKGAIEGAKMGAVAVIVRSMTTNLDDYPHTGAMRYEDGVEKIPSAAISTNGAELLSSLLKKEPNLEFSLLLSCETLPDAPSANVVGELKGSEFPNEFISVGGHLDSWDLAEGAHDDGAGTMQSIEVLEILKGIGYKPRHTIRAVMFMNEENGLKGGMKYAELAKEKGEKHIAAIETDAGGFVPRGFGLSGDSLQILKVQSWLSLFEPYLIHFLKKGGGGADIGPLKDQGALLIGLSVDSQRYFDHHHAANDVFEAVNKRELELGSAAMAALIYMIDKYGLS